MKKADRLNKLEMSKIRMTSKLMDQLEAEGRDIIIFTYGEPNFDTPKYIKDACTDALYNGHTKYSDYNGPIHFRQAVCDKYERENGLKFFPDQVISTHGSAQAAYLVLTTFLNPGDEIIIPNPMYNIYRIIAEICGAAVKEYKLKEENEFQIDLKEMERLITDKTKMIVICSPSNPIGSVLTEENLRGLGELVKDKDLLICSDEIYDRLVYDGVEAVSPAKFDTMRDKTIIINGFSKAFAMTGWRMGIAAGPAEVIFHMNKIHQFTTMSAGTTSQYAALEALTSPVRDEEIDVMRQEYDERRHLMVDGFRAMGLKVVEPEGAFYVFPSIKETGLTSMEFCSRLLQEQKVAVIPGDAFGSCGEGYIRCSYAYSKDVIKKCLEKIAAFVAQFDLEQNA